MTYKILQIGYGNMGKAIADNFDVKELDIDLTIIDKNIKYNKQGKKFNNLEQLKTEFKADFILLAIKPQSVDSIIKDYKNFFSSNTIIISILAGTELKYFRKYFPENPIVRLMPNLGAKLKKSVNLIYAEGLNRETKAFISKLANSFGHTIWLKCENLLHAGTAVAGSGPAYYYNFLAIYRDYLVKEGFTIDDAKQVAILTAKAAIETSDQDDFGNLIKQVSSKGGTTEAALSVLNEDNILADTIYASLNEAVKRSKDLAN